MEGRSKEEAGERRRGEEKRIEGGCGLWKEGKKEEGKRWRRRKEEEANGDGERGELDKTSAYILKVPWPLGCPNVYTIQQCKLLFYLVMYDYHIDQNPKD